MSFFKKNIRIYNCTQWLKSVDELNMSDLAIEYDWRRRPSRFRWLTLLVHWLASSPLQHSRTTVRVCEQ